MIEILDLHVRFGSVHALRGVSMTIEKGQSYGLVGESGSGKTTVLRALTGLIENWTGHIHFAGEALSHRRTKAFHKAVQMVFQDPYGSLHPRHTVDRILSEPLIIHGFDRIEARILSTLSDVGLGPSFRFRYPHQLSGGQRQRIAIARAIIMEPLVLLLDEPTSALDVSVQAEILNLLKRLQREHGLTFLLVSHNLPVIAHMCTRVSVMNAGLVLEELSSDELHRRRANSAYTQRLLAASEGYHPALVRDLAALAIEEGR
ncbi:MAG TPA: ABC transporter ATP-binding protein [Alphaproteobacteria bacterium]|nr:ABC transporter ATP-binding protein [Alphaproteobacteria bacterium]